ncbi:hypothetical protein [Hydrogenophaga defluvii]|uniref:Uncharacterized protein n=1 Tax=Hydrogenophaga defluvii TaxID=249410 RepID=A0ABW2SBX8_9BURK
MTKLTKDQRRAQKKQKERKQSRQLEQAFNRKIKTMAPAMATIHAAVEQFVERDVLENAFVTLFKGASAKSLPAPFHDAAWQELQAHTKALIYHSILFAYDPENAEDSTLRGRAYFFPDDDHRPVKEHFPFAAVMASKWPIRRVVQELSQEILGKVTPGAYVFGIPFGYHGVNFAVVTSKDAPDVPAYYLVTADDWHLLNKDACDELLVPILIDAFSMYGEEDSQHNSDLRMIGVLNPELQEAVEEGVPPALLTPLMRQAIMAAGSGLCDQVDMLVDVLREMEEEQEEMGKLASPDQDYEDGLRDGERQRDELLARLKAAEEQIQAMKRQAASRPKVAPEVPATARALALSERMGALLAPLH